MTRTHAETRTVAETVYADTAVIVNRIAEALRILDDWAAGYADHTPMSSPSSAHTPPPDDDGPAPKLTPVERAAFGPDNAAETRELIDRTLDHLERCARIARRAVEKITVPPPVAEGEPNPETDIWCRHHARFGIMEPRAAKRGELCEWCYSFMVAYNPVRVEPLLMPSRRLLELKAEGRRIDQGTIARLMPETVQDKQIKRKRGKK